MTSHRDALTEASQLRRQRLEARRLLILELHQEGCSNESIVERLCAAHGGSWWGNWKVVRRALAEAGLTKREHEERGYYIRNDRRLGRVERRKR